MIHDQPDEGLDLIIITKPLVDAGKYLALIIYKQTQTRKAFIEPGLSKEAKAILKDTKFDDFLYGKELTEKLKDAKAMIKLAETLKPTQQKPASPPKQNLNQKPPFVKRSNRMRSTSSEGQAKQKVFFKGKQQFINQNAQQFPQQQKAQGKPQEKKD